VFCPQANPDLFSDSDFAFLLTNFKKIFIDFTIKLGSLRGPRQQHEKNKRSVEKKVYGKWGNLFNYRTI